jgi:hypothetical protein
VQFTLSTPTARRLPPVSMNAQQHREEDDLFDADSLERRQENDARLRGLSAPPEYRLPPVPTPLPRLPSLGPSSDTPRKIPRCKYCLKRNSSCSNDDCYLLRRSPSVWNRRYESDEDRDVQTPSNSISESESGTVRSRECVRGTSDATPDLTFGASLPSSDLVQNGEDSSDSIVPFSSPSASQNQAFMLNSSGHGLLSQPVSLISTDGTATSQEFGLNNLTNEENHLAREFPSSQSTTFWAV